MYGNPRYKKNPSLPKGWGPGHMWQFHAVAVGRHQNGESSIEIGAGR